MGSRLTKELLQGILVPDERVTLENIHSGSSYTEQGPRPGVPVPDNAASTLRPIVTSSQVADVRAGIVRAGGVGAAEIAYKLDSEGATSWRGYSYPSAPVYCDVWSEDAIGSNGLRWFDCATDPNTQDVYAAYTNQSGALRFVRWNAQTWEPGSTVVIDAAATVGTAEQRGVAVQVQSSGRIVVWAGVLSYYSDDGGTNWAEYATGAYATAGNPTSNIGPQRVIRVGGDYMAIQLVSDGIATNTDDAYQYASTDQGQTWREVGGVFDFAYDLDAAEAPDGSAWIAYIDTAGDLKALRVTGAFESVQDALPSALTVMGRCEAVAIAIDPNGAAYIYGRNDERVIGHELIDGAWVEMTTGGADFQAEANAPTKFAACMSNGAVAMISDASPAAGRSPDNKQLRGVLWGGFSTLVADHNGSQIDAPGFDGDRNTIAYQPITTPDAAAAWAAVGTPSGSASITAEGLSINGANVAYQFTAHGSGNGGGLTCQWGVKVSTADASGTDPVPGLVLVQHNGTDQSTVKVIYRATQIEIYDDLASSVLATVTVDTTVDRIYSLSITTAGAIVFGSRLKGETVWSITTATASTASATASSSSVQWGNIGGSSARASIWQFVQFRAVVDAFGPFYWVHGQADLVGRVLNGIPTPCPVIGNDGTQVAYLHAEGGDAPDQAAYTIDAAHDYPVEATLPQVSPSPSIGWRSTSTAEQSIAWDFGSTNTDRSYMGKAIGLYLDGCNFRTCELEASLNGTAWTTIQSIDLSSGVGASNVIPYTLAGDVLTFGAGAADRYLFGEMLRGSHVIIAAGGSTVSRKIAANLSGAVSASGTTSRPALRLEALDGTESASGNCVIVSSRALSVSFTATLQAFRYWRVRIPAGQDVCGIGSDPETGYRVGSLVLGEWLAYGGGTGIGWTESAAPNYAETVSRRGTRYRKSYGPPARRWSLVWDEADRFLDSVTPDYVANDGTDQPLAARAEIYEQLRAIAIRTGALSVPVVASRYVPAATGTTVWPSTMLYGHISGEVELQQVTGDNDFSAQQVIRAGNIQIDEVI